MLRDTQGVKMKENVAANYLAAIGRGVFKVMAKDRFPDLGGHNFFS